MLSSPLTSRDRNEFISRQAYGSEANAVSDFQVSLYSRGTRGLLVGDLREVRDRPDTMRNPQESA
jgi:hypothetical protein